MNRPCSACGFDSLVDFFDLGCIPVCDDFRVDEVESLNLQKVPLSTSLCQNCFHFELNHKEDCRQLYSNYLYRTSHSSDLNSHFSSYAQYLRSLLPKGSTGSSFSLLDVGCNDGTLLKKIEEIFCAMELYGVDPSPACSEIGGKINVFQEFFSWQLIRRENFFNKFDVILTNNTFANIDEISAFFGCLKACLSKEGILIIETGYGPLTLINEVWDMVNHEHYHYFSLTSLQALAKRHDLKLLDATIVATKGGSIRATFCNRDSKINTRSGACASLSAMEMLMFRFPKIITQRICQRLQFLRTTAQELLREQKRLALIGASAGGTILVYLLGLEKAKMSLLDDNVARHGRYLPGTSIRVSAFDDIESFEDVVVINLAWRFSRDLLNRHPELRQSKSFLLGNTLAEVLDD